MNISNLRGSGNRKSPIAWDFPRHVKLKMKIPNGAAEIATFNHFSNHNTNFLYTLSGCFTYSLPFLKMAKEFM